MCFAGDWLLFLQPQQFLSSTVAREQERICVIRTIDDFLDEWKYEVEATSRMLSQITENIRIKRYATVKVRSRIAWLRDGHASR